MSNRTIHLGYIHMSSWTSESQLADDCYFDEEDSCYNEKFAKKVRALAPNGVVLKKGVYTLKITYPLRNPFICTITVNEIGMTRRQLINRIVRAYKAIYATAEDDNPYGIWGHCMSDLMLHTAYVTPQGDHHRQLRFLIDFS